jgi:iron complex transport system substrate-binding protein
LRLLSLLPSATETIYALGLGHLLVGRSHECDYPPEAQALPVCSRSHVDPHGSSVEIHEAVLRHSAQALSIFDVIPEVLAELQPDLILTQTQCRVCAVSLSDVEAALASMLPGTNAPRILSLEPHSLGDVRRDFRRIAEACEASEAGEALVDRFDTALLAIAARTRPRKSHPRVACIEWIEPLMAAGNWIPEMVTLLGAQNLLGQAGQHSSWLTMEQLSVTDPDQIFVCPCGFDLEKTRSEMHYLEAKPEWQALRAVQNGKVHLADGSAYFNRPGPRLSDSLAILAEAIYGA